MATQFIHPSAKIVPSARLAENTFVWPETQIGAQVTTGILVQIGANTRIYGDVTIRIGVHIGNGVTLVGPMEIGQDVVIGDGAAVGAVIAQKSTLEKTMICKEARIGEKAQVLGRLSIGKYAWVAAGAHLEGDLPQHGLAKGVPAALWGFVCWCGKEYQLVRATSNVCDLACPAGHGQYRVTASDFSHQTKFLLPNGQAGEPVPAWWQPT